MCQGCGTGTWSEPGDDADEWWWLDEGAGRADGPGHRHLDRIDSVGWAVEAVPGDGFDLPYAYTVGLTRYHGHPEVLVSGVGRCGALEYLDAVGERIRAGERFRFGDELRLGRERAVLLAVDQPERLEQAQVVYARPGGRLVPALQLVLSDGRGRMPWEPRWGGWPQALFGTPRSAA